MARTIKDPALRRREIVQAAAALFESRGYAATSVDAIIAGAGIAKGTFYWYFNSKEAVLEALAQDVVAGMADQARALARQSGVPCLGRLAHILGAANRSGHEHPGTLDALHRPENRELHLAVNCQTIHQLSPILAGLLEEGRDKGEFRVEQPLATVQLLLTAGQFLLDESFFSWSASERRDRLAALQHLVARALDLDPAQLAFLLGLQAPSHPESVPGPAIATQPKEHP